MRCYNPNTASQNPRWTYKLLALLLGLKDLGNQGVGLAVQTLLELAASAAVHESGQLLSLSCEESEEMFNDKFTRRCLRIYPKHATKEHEARRNIMPLEIASRAPVHAS